MGWIICGDRHLTTGDLHLRARKAATVLADCGVTAGDGVGLLLRNGLSVFEAAIATGMLGAFAVPINWHSAPDEVAYVLADSGVKVLVAHADLLRPVAAAIPPDMIVLVVESSAELMAAYGIAPEAAVAQNGSRLWATLVDAAPPSVLPPREPPSTIIYTSGTTGRAKGVRRTLATPEQAAGTARMLARSYGYTDALEGRRDPATITTAVIGPVYHAAPNGHANFSIGLGVNVLVCARFDAEALLAAIERHRITHLNMVPIMFVRLLRLPEAVRRRYDLSSLEYVTHAAAPCPPPVKRAMIDWLGPIVWEYYGSTEMGNVAGLSSSEWLAHPGSVGRVMPDTDLRVIDAQGRTVAAGEIGEVVARIRDVSDFTYHNAPEKRDEMDRDGLIAPGDIGYLDADGYLYLCDRRNNMVISGGVNIYPAEIEAELHKFPEVADCAVFGIPDDMFGEAVHAVIQPMPGAEIDVGAIRAALQPRLAAYKIPRTMDIACDLPREDSGKIFTRKLREPFWAGKMRNI